MSDKKVVRKKAANRREPEPTIQIPKGEMTTTTTKTTKNGKKKVTTKKVNLRKRLGGRPKTGEPSYSAGQKTILLYLLGKKATIAARAIDRDKVWKETKAKSSCQTLRDKGLMDRSDLENGEIKLFLTKEGVTAATTLAKEDKPSKKVGTKKVAKKKAAKK